MSGTAIRIKKEARALFWPWLVVTAFGALPPFLPPGLWLGPISLEIFRELLPVLMFFFGIPLLAAFALAYEYQHRTFSLWLAAPYSRLRLWWEKTAVMFAAVTSAAILACLGLFSVWPGLTFFHAVFAFSWVLLTASSAFFWTLTTRTAIGGVFLSASIPGLVFWVVTLATMRSEGVSRAMSSIGTAPGLTFWMRFTPAVSPYSVATFAILYSATMLWLGARKFAQLQITSSSGGDAAMAGAPFVSTIAHVFRSRPSGALGNLIRKEIVLMHLFWMAAAGTNALIFALALFRSLRGADSVLAGLAAGNEHDAGAMFTQFGLLPLLAVLGGCMPVGEEEAAGMESWQATLPVPVRVQWLLKLIVAMAASLISAFLLPVALLIAAGSIHGGTAISVQLSYLGFLPMAAWTLCVSLITLTSFWCACVAKSTLRAVLLVAPVVSLIFAAGGTGLWLGSELTRTTGTVAEWTTAWRHLDPLTLSVVRLDIGSSALASIGAWVQGVAVIFAPALLYAVIRSYGLFRAARRDSLPAILRCVAPLVFVSFLGGALYYAAVGVSDWSPSDEVRNAVELQRTKDRPEESFRTTGDTLATRAPLSRLTRRWLSGSTIAVAPAAPGSRVNQATIRLVNGAEYQWTLLPSTPPSPATAGH